MFEALLSEPVLVSATPDLVVVDNGTVSLSVARTTGRFHLKLGPEAIVEEAYGEAKLPDGAVKRTTDFGAHLVRTRAITDAWGKGVRVEVSHRGSGDLEMRHVFWLYQGSREILVRLDLLSPKGAASNMVAPIVSEDSVWTKPTNRLQALFVPYDNDNYFRYSSQGWGEEPEYETGSSEVGALYDNSSRRGLVVGSIDHEVWKSGVRFTKHGAVRAVSGVVSKYSHDHEPHGTVTGKTVSSSRFSVGFYDDWRSGLEMYGELNARVSQPLKWQGGPPFGWNSWSGHKTKVSREAMTAATEFLDKEIPWLRNDGVAYVNFDSFWDNLTREQRIEVADKAHKAGMKAGIYWTPFVNWGEPDWKTSGGYHFRDLQLKNSKGEFLPKLDGGWPLDPTHPGTLLRIEEQLRDFVDQGFDYIKLDFLTHGALEGAHHDPKVQTGTAAYLLGMKKILAELSPQKVGRPIFISLSIAPMFPHGLAHSRRISCDVFSNIGASEYFLNSLNYGWWAGGRLYQFNDPDSACVYQALGEDSTTEPEARTRFTASIIGGGMMIEGDDLTNPAAKERVRRIFSNRELLALASKAPEFRPVDGATGSRAGDTFVHRASDGSVWVALFNFSKTETREASVPFAHLNLKGTWSAKESWTGRITKVEGSLTASLAPTDCAIFRLTREQ